MAQLIFLLSPIDVALADGDGYSQVIDFVATVYVGIKENLNNNLKTLFMNYDRLIGKSKKISTTCFL